MRIPTPFAVFLGVVLGGLILPFALGRERAAKAAFEYVPPPGFTPATGEARRRLLQGSAPAAGTGGETFLPVDAADLHADRQAWVGTPQSPLAPAPRIVLVHNPAHTALDESVLGRIASEMSEHQRSQGLDYALTKKKMVERSDGARVGFVTWDVSSLPSSSQPATPPRHAIQISFPDNDGISIVTAQFLAADDAAVAPLIEASVHEAHGVAVRPGPLPIWARLLGAVGGGALGFLLARALRRSRAPKTA